MPGQGVDQTRKAYCNGVESNDGWDKKSINEYFRVVYYNASITSQLTATPFSDWIPHCNCTTTEINLLNST